MVGFRAMLDGGAQPDSRLGTLITDRDRRLSDERSDRRGARVILCQHEDFGTNIPHVAEGEAMHDRDRYDPRFALERADPVDDSPHRLTVRVEPRNHPAVEHALRRPPTGRRATIKQ